MAETPTAVIARRMRALRQGKFTADQLAQAMREHGIPWQRTVVAKLENGRRDTVSVGELFALALVLDVTPAALLVDLDDPTAEVVPGLTVTPLDLLMWLQMKAPLPGRDLGTSRFPHREARIVSNISDVWAEILGMEDFAPPARYDERLERVLADRRAVLRDLLSMLVGEVAIPRQISDYLEKHPDEAAD